MKDDIKAIADLTSSFEKFAVWSNLLLLFLAIWIRTSHLQVTPKFDEGVSTVSGLNVGHAIVFTPIVALFLVAFSASVINRRERLREAVASRLRADADVQKGVTPVERAALETPAMQGDRFERLAQLLKGIVLFAIPSLAAIVAFLRYLDFHPAGTTGNEIAPNLLSRLSYHLFSTGAWEKQAALNDHYLDTHDSIAKEMPYIYSPVQGWVYLVVIAVLLVLATQSWRGYFKRISIGATQATGAMPAQLSDVSAAP